MSNNLTRWSQLHDNAELVSRHECLILTHHIEVAQGAQNADLINCGGMGVELAHYRLQ